MDPYLLASNIRLYEQAPQYFTGYQLDAMEQAAQQHGINFKRKTELHDQQLEQEAQGSSNVLSQFASGVFEGFFGPFAFGGWADEPETEAQALASSMGHLIGFVPGLAGGIFKGGATLLAKGVGMTGATATAARVLRSSNTAYESFAKSAFATSIPLKAADYANTWTIGKIADAGYDVNKYLKSGNKTADIIKSAQHLGVASAVSSFWEGPAGIAQSYAHGLIAGGWFGTVGNFMNVGKLAHSAKLTDRLRAEDWIWNNAAKGMAGSLFQGGMATLHGAPTVTQIYEYMLGGYFGWKHPSATVRIAREYMAEYKKDHPLRSEEFDMLKKDSFKELPEKSQEYVTEYFSRVIGDLKRGVEEAAAEEGPGSPLARLLKDVLSEQRDEIIKKAEIKFNKTKEELTDQEIFQVEADEIWKPMFELTENQLDVSRIASSIADGKTAELVGADREVYEALPKELREQIKAGDANAVEAMNLIAQEIQRGRINDKAAENIQSMEESLGEQNEVIRSNIRLKDFLVELQKIAIEQNISEIDVMNAGVDAYNKTLQAKEGYNEFVKRFWADYPTITPSERQERFLKQLFRRLQTESFHTHYAWERDGEELHPVLNYNRQGKLVRNSKPDSPDELHFRQKLLNVVETLGQRFKGFSIELIKGITELGENSGVRLGTKLVKPKLSKTSGISIQRDGIFGNPFVVPTVYDKNPKYYKDLGFVRAKSRQDAIDSYEQWLRKEKFEDFLPERRDEILAVLESGQLSGKTLRYFKPKAEDSHAVRLVKLAMEMGPKPYTIKYGKTGRKTQAGTRVGASVNYESRTITIDKARLREMWLNKSWTKPKMKGVTALHKEAFKNYEEFERFVLEHELAHTRLPQRKGETKAQYENRINREALKQLHLSKGSGVEVNKKNKVLKVNQTILREKFKAKSWIKEGLDPDAFKEYKDFELYEVEKELIRHKVSKKKKGETQEDFDKRVAKYAFLSSQNKRTVFSSKQQSRDFKEVEVGYQVVKPYENFYNWATRSFEPAMEPDAWRLVTYELDSKGYYPKIPKKDTGVERIHPYHPETTKRTLGSIFKEILEMYPESQIKKIFQYDQQQYLDMMTEVNSKGEKETLEPNVRKELERMHEKAFISNFLYEKNYKFKGTADRVKRETIIGDQEIPLNSLDYLTVAPEGKLEVVFLDDSKAGGIKEFFRTEEGLKLADSKTDGAVIFHSELFKLVRDVEGFSGSTSRLKPTSASWGPDGSLFLLKAGVHPSRSQYDNILNPNQIIVFTSSAKSIPTGAKIYEGRVLKKKNGEVEYRFRGVKKGDKPVGHKINVEDLRMNYGVYEDSGASKPQRFKKQFHSFLNSLQVSQKGFDSFMRETVDKAIEGNSNTNKLAEEWLKDPTKIPSRKDFHIKDISYELVTRILNEHINHPIYKELVADMIRQTRFTETEEMIGMESEIAEVKEYTSRLEKWMKATDFHPIVPQLIENNLYQAMVLKYTHDKLTYPEWKYSGTGRVAAVDPIVEAVHGEIAHNGFKLGHSHSQMLVKWSATGEEIPLQKAWDSYKKVRDGGRFKGRAKMMREMEEDLRFALMRVPSPAVSGTRILMFNGFVRNDLKLEDYGVYTRSRDHFYFDGADTDMDGLYFYQGLPKEFKAEIWKNRHELEYKDGKGRWVMMKNKDPKFNNDYGSELNAWERLIAEKNVADPAAQWLPWGLRQAGMSGFQGKQGMGQVINAKTFLNTIAADLMKNHDGILDIELTHKGKVWGKIKGTTSEDIINGRFRQHLVEASSRTADSANYFRINNPKQVIEFLTKQLFPDIRMEVWDKEKKDYVEKEFDYNAFRSSHYADLLAVNNLLYGKNWRSNRMWTLEEVQEQLSSITAQGDYMSSIWHIGKSLSQYKIQTNPLRFWSEENAFKVWRESFKVFNEAFKKDRTLKDLLVRKDGLRVIPRYILTSQVAKDRLQQYYEENNVPTNKRRRTVRWVDMGLKGLRNPDERVLPKGEQDLFNKLWTSKEIKRPSPEKEAIMRLNDTMDVWSALNIASKGTKLLDALKKKGIEDRFPEIAEDLGVFADKIKKRYIVSRGLDFKTNVPTRETVDNINKIIRTKKADIIKQGEFLGIDAELLNQYLYARMLGSIYSRGSHKDKVKRELEKYIKKLEEADSTDASELLHWKNKLADFQKFYNKTSSHRFPIETQEIPDAVKKEFMQGYSGTFDLLKTGFENVATVEQLARERDRISEVVKERSKIREKTGIETELDREAEIREELMQFTDKPLDNLWDIETTAVNKKDIPKDIPGVLERIAEHFKGLPPAALYRVNDIFAFMTAERDGIAMSVNQMRWQDLRDLERFMADIHKYGTKDKSPTGLYYFLFPERAAQKMLTHDYTQVWKTPMPYVDSVGGKSMRSVDVPMGTMQLLNNSFGHIYTMENALKQQWQGIRDEMYDYRNDILSMENGTVEWEKIHRVAVATMLRDSRSNPRQREFYESLFKENEKDWLEIKDKTYEITEEGGQKKTYTGEQIIEKIHESHNRFFDNVYQKFVKSGIDFDLIDDKGIYTKQNEIMQWDQYGRLQIDSALQRILKPIVSGNLASTRLIGRNGLTVEMLNRIQYEWALEAMIEKDPTLRKPDGTINNQKAHRFRRRFRMDEVTKFNPIGRQEQYFPQMMHLATKESRAKVRKWMEEQTVELRNYLENALRIRRSSNDRSLIDNVGKDIDRRFQITDAEFKRLETDKNFTEEMLIEQKMAQQERAFETNLGRRLNQDGGAGEHAAQWMDAQFSNPADLVAAGFFSRPGSGRARGPVPMPGFSMDFDVTQKYADQWVSAFYRNATSLLAKKKIDEYVKRNPLKDESATQQWANVMRFYARDVMGYPTLFSKEMMSLTKDERQEYENTIQVIKKKRGRRSNADKVKLAAAENALKLDAGKPKFEGISGSVYYGLTDQAWVNKFDSISRKFFNGKIPFYGELPKDPIARHKAITRILHNIGSFEAKWTLISLLAHPKTLIGNALGGSHNTISRVGMRHWLNSRDLAYLTQNVFKGAMLKDGTKIDSWDTIQRWVEEIGATENFIVNEAQLERAFTGKRAGSFLNEMLKRLRNDPNLPDSTVYEVAKKHGLTQTFVDKAAWFMRYSERMLRRDAFISHYLNAREIMSKIQPEYRFDNPFLIQFGLEGVKATQFLYHSAFRPAFSRTTMGKVMTRFHPFAWNSIRLRRETYLKAKRYGFDPDSIPAKRLERLMVLDGMVFALANIFVSSMFDSSMPPPMSWMQDTADWLFGDPKDREKAFFNQYPHPALAPLSIITPPSGRYPLNLLNGMINGNWERFADYQVFTWFPFGRLARSTLKTIETPEMILEQMTGFPIHGIGRRMRKGREEEDE